jgi:hypothetical protein
MTDQSWLDVLVPSTIDFFTARLQVESGVQPITSASANASSAGSIGSTEFFDHAQVG